MQIISAGTGPRRRPTLELLLAGQPAENLPMLDASELDDMPLDGLLAAEIDGRIVGAALFFVQEDRTGYVWPPVISDERPIPASEIADALLGAVATELDARNVWLGQCVIDPERAADRENLSRGGFGHLADLSMMERALSLPIAEATPPRLSTVPFRPGSNDSRFAEVLARTYTGTLDCPGLDRWRSPAEALASHRLAGEFDPRLWHVYVDGAADVGLLLATDHSEEHSREVVYMGVVPEFRGRRYGQALLNDALRAAQDAGCARMRLAVDLRNAPAIGLYDEAGFVATCRRAVHGRPRRA